MNREANTKPLDGINGPEMVEHIIYDLNSFYGYDAIKGSSLNFVSKKEDGSPYDVYPQV